MILNDNPNLLTGVHEDWVQWLSTSAKGRDGSSSDQLMRALIVLFIEGKSYRHTVILIDNSDFLRHFVRLGLQSTMDFTFLNRAYSSLSETTMHLFHNHFVSSGLPKMVRFLFFNAAYPPERGKKVKISQRKIGLP